MNQNSVNYKLVNILLALLIVCLLYWIKGLWLGIVGKIIEVLFPFVLAFAVAYALYPYRQKLENVGFPKWLSIAVIYFIIFGFLIMLLILVVPLLYDQIVLFLSNISAVITDISSKFEVDLGMLQSMLSNVSSDILENVGTYISDGAINIVNASINVITSLFIIAIVSVYFLFDMDKIRKYIKKKLKNRSYKYIQRLDSEINNYFSGLLRNMLIQCVEYTVVFGLIGHPNYLILGILAGITNIIPFFGALVVNVTAFIIASVVSTKLCILTLIVCIICPNIDSYIISPKVYGKTNQLHPLVNIFAVFAGGILGGLWGIILSLPIAIIIIATYKFFKEDINTKIDSIKERKA